jgi:hypothetical protein
MDNDDRRPLAFPSTDARGPSYDAAVERTQAAYAAVRPVLADRPILDTVGDLAALVAKLPPEVPLTLDDQVTIDARLSSAGDNPVFAVVASMATLASRPLLPVRDNTGHEFDVLEPALELGTQVLPSADTAAAVDTRPYYLPARIDDALDRGEVGQYLTLLARQCRQFAGHLTGKAGQYLPGGSTPEMAAIAATLRGVADRLTAHAPHAEDLINYGADDYRDEV